MGFTQKNGKLDLIWVGSRVLKAGFGLFRLRFGDQTAKGRQDWDKGTVATIVAVGGGATVR